MTTSDAIVAEGLTKRFGDTTALAGINLRVPAGTVYGLLGPNGAGKTTAVRILATLLPPDGGRAAIGGWDVVRHAHQVRQLIGLTGQYASVDELLTGTENLLLIGRLLGLSRRAAKARAAELLEAFRLSDVAHKPARTYSGGMRRRLDLAASLVGRPQVLYLDEPTTGLDPRSRNEMWDLIRRLVADGMTVLLTTQYLEEADQLADDIAVIDHGQMIAEGTPAELKAKIGGQSLTIRPMHATDLDIVVAVVTELVGRPPAVANGVVTAAVADQSMLGAAVRRLEDAGVVVGELSLRGATLDEVFLTLTGHRAKSAESADETAHRSAA